ncbi:MAG: energy-coupling factor transporter transmembrane protein EcfT [Bacteroidales bacterium]|nr:energy-coupling factor transporter transmembrane protein EcfT [Bacteroidales bacterium]
MIPQFLRQPNSVGSISRKTRSRFVEKTLLSLSKILTVSVNRYLLSSRNGFLQKMPDIIKVWALIFFPVAVSLVNHIVFQFFFLFIILLFSFTSKVNFWLIARHVVIYVLIFGFLVSLPASLNIFNEGKILVKIFSFNHGYHWWIYNIPQEIGITREGMIFVGRMCFKIFNSVSFVLLVIATTGFENTVRALRSLRVPHFFLLIITLTYHYIIVISRNLHQSFQAMRLRWWNSTQSPLEKEIASGRIGFLFRKGWENYELTYKSMIARGFTGEFRLINSNNKSKLGYVIGFFMFALLLLIVYIDRNGFSISY